MPRPQKLVRFTLPLKGCTRIELRTSFDPAILESQTTTIPLYDRSKQFDDYVALCAECDQNADKVGEIYRLLVWYHCITQLPGAPKPSPDVVEDLWTRIRGASKLGCSRWGAAPFVLSMKVALFIRLEERAGRPDAEIAVAEGAITCRRLGRLLAQPVINSETQLRAVLDDLCARLRQDESKITDTEVLEIVDRHWTSPHHVVADEDDDAPAPPAPRPAPVAPVAPVPAPVPPVAPVPVPVAPVAPAPAPAPPVPRPAPAPVAPVPAPVAPVALRPAPPAPVPAPVAPVPAPRPAPVAPAPSRTRKKSRKRTPKKKKSPTSTPVADGDDDDEDDEELVTSVGCSGCDEWFDVPDADTAEFYNDDVDEFYCPQCEEDGVGVTSVFHACDICQAKTSALESMRFACRDCITEYWPTMGFEPAGEFTQCCLCQVVMRQPLMTITVCDAPACSRHVTNIAQLRYVRALKTGGLMRSRTQMKERAEAVKRATRESETVAQLKTTAISLLRKHEAALCAADSESEEDDGDEDLPELVAPNSDADDDVDALAPLSPLSQATSVSSSASSASWSSNPKAVFLEEVVLEPRRAKKRPAPLVCGRAKRLCPDKSICESASDDIRVPTAVAF